MSKKIGINEIILEKQIKLQERAIAKIVNIVKGEKPFAMEEISPDEKLWVVDNLGSQDVNDLINEFGLDAVDRLYGEAIELKNRRSK